MPNQRERISSAVPILLLATLLMGCGAMLWLLVATPLLARAQATRDLQRARARWRSLAIDDYRIVVETTVGRLPCRRVAEVRGGQVIGVDTSSCAVVLGTPPDPTVPALFDKVN